MREVSGLRREAGREGQGATWRRTGRRGDPQMPGLLARPPLQGCGEAGSWETPEGAGPVSTRPAPVRAPRGLTAASCPSPLACPSTQVPCAQGAAPAPGRGGRAEGSAGRRPPAGQPGLGGPGEAGGEAGADRGPLPPATRCEDARAPRWPRAGGWGGRGGAGAEGDGGAGAGGAGGAGGDLLRPRRVGGAQPLR